MPVQCRGLACSAARGCIKSRLAAGNASSQECYKENAVSTGRSPPCWFVPQTSIWAPVGYAVCAKLGVSRFRRLIDHVGGQRFWSFAAQGGWLVNISGSS